MILTNAEQGLKQGFYVSLLPQRSCSKAQQTASYDHVNWGELKDVTWNAVKTTLGKVCRLMLRIRF